jgi:hypothetical protein
MSTLLEFIQRFLDAFIWWSIIQPWEQGIRVRLGKKRIRLEPGIHFKIPYADHVYIQTARRRYSNFGPLTATSKDNHTITLAGAVGFSISDLDKLYDKLQSPEDALHAISTGTVAGFIATHDLSECSPENIIAKCRPRLGLRRFGLKTEDFLLTTYARVRTYRLIMDTQPPDTWGDGIDTERHDA